MRSQLLLAHIGRGMFYTSLANLSKRTTQPLIGLLAIATVASPLPALAQLPAQNTTQYTAPPAPSQANPGYTLGAAIASALIRFSFLNIAVNLKF